MPLTRHEVTIAVGEANEVTLEALPFNWPRNNWEVLEIEVSRETGWRDLTSANIVKLLAQYGGAKGQVFKGLNGLIVQYVEGTGSAAFTVTDWRGNTGSFVFLPNVGLEIEELHGTATETLPLGTAFHEARLRLVKV